MSARRRSKLRVSQPVVMIDLTRESPMRRSPHVYSSTTELLKEPQLRKTLEKKDTVTMIKCDVSCQTDKENVAPGARLGDCPVCLEVLGTSALASTSCGHVFCLACLKQALQQECRCPTCRLQLRGANAYHPLYIGNCS